MSDTKVIAKKNHVTCWNCFTTEDQDKLSDVEDDSYQPVALPKVREEHREKFKLYSFLASELAKPKAVPFKQTVSKHCTIAKKIDQKFVEQLTKDTEDMNLDCGENTPEETLNKNFKPNPENIVQTTDTDNEDLDDSNKVLDLQDVEITTSRDITDGNILENTTECPKLTITENVASLSETNKATQRNSDCLNLIQHELSNDSKITELELALPPIIIGSTELSTPLQLQEEISFIASQKDPALNKHDLQSGITIVSDNNIESTISSDLAIDIKSTTDINYCAEDMKDSNVLPEVNCENSKTNSITKLPILKQNINSRYSPLFKLKKSPSTDKTTVPHDRIDIIYKSLSETVPIVCRKNYKEMNTKVDPKTTVSASLSNIESKPLTPLSKNKTEAKNIPLLPNQSKTKCSSTEVSPINKHSYLSKISTVTSKSLPSLTPPTLRKTIQKEPITSFKSPIAKINTIISAEKISILKRKSTEPKSPNSTDRNYCSESTEDVNLSQGVHPSKYSKNDIGTKLPVFKQNLNSKYSPLHKLKIGISKDKIVSNKDDTEISTSVQSESSRPEHGKKSEETTSEIKNLSDSNDSTSDIQLVSSTPKDKEIDNKSDVSDETYKSSITKSLYSLAESTAESEVPDECKNIDKSDIKKCASNEKVEKEINIDVLKNKKFLKPRSISTEELGKKLCPKLRRSTLSMDPRSLNFTDEMYISEESPGHATLPRRSNSPLPHDRDLDRERFPLNRSGLQTRSESMASVYSGAGEGVRGGVPVRGEVQFSLVYNYRLGALEVGVKRCRDLAPIDVKKNRSDPYVKVYLLPDKSKTGKRKTKVKKNTLNPVFEETLSFQSSLESLSTRALWLSAWHADMFGRNDFLGEVTLPLAGRVFDDPAPSWHALGERSECPEESSGSRGDLIVGLKFELEPRASTGTLHVLVKEARRLVPSRAGALADVFCKSYLLPERGRLHKQKTPVCRRTLAPVWRAGLQYTRVAPQGLAERALELTLWDRDRLASNEFLGAVRLSRGTGMYRGESVNWMDSTGKEVSLWETMLQQPNFWVEGSLPLRPHLNN